MAPTPNNAPSRTGFGRLLLAAVIGGAIAVTGTLITLKIAGDNLASVTRDKPRPAPPSDREPAAPAPDNTIRDAPAGPPTSPGPDNSLRQNP